MELSIIIVNYNVKFFLEQCLHSVLKATKNISAEIFVVDNNSVDGSVQFIPERFPEINFIANPENVGFSKANNQAIKIARGKYVLLLNPDTVVEEDTFEKVIAFMDTHPDAGGLGVKMIDGKGNFLPESKRGLPTPWVAFYKIFGLSKLFKKSKKFGKYHLSFLDEEKIHEVDVLSGAFMLLRESVLHKIGLLDETFFMYGEDIDMSYRVSKAGFKNYYFPETTIIHYKGESTKKGTLNYVKAFYNAMNIFARKHFSGGKAGFFSLFIHLAIYFRALLSVSARFFDKISMPAFDSAIIFSGFLLLTPIWEKFRFEQGYYPPEFLKFVVPVYMLFWVLGIFLSGGYKKPVNLLKIARGILWGTVSILLVYSLADMQFRFSRALILLGSAWSTFALVLYRLIFHWLKIKGFRLDIRKTKKIAIAGHLPEAQRVHKLIEQTPISSEIAGFVGVGPGDKGQGYIGQISQLKEIIQINRIDEVIFCAESISSGEIIKAMLDLSQLNVDYKIAPPESVSIIGSNSIHTAGDLYVLNLNAISKASNKRKKRVFDVFLSVFLLLLSPFVVWLFEKKASFIANVSKVLAGSKTWVGYINNGDNLVLPKLKTGVLSPGDMFPEIGLDKEREKQLDVIYAKDYNILTDAEIVLKGWKNLDRQ